MLELYDGSGKLLVSNDDWKTDDQQTIQATGFAPSNDLESAIVRTLSPGNYTAILRGKNNTSGVGLVEAYDLSHDSASRLGNISTRGFVSTGDNVMIGGFIVGGNGGGSTDVIVRALGPSLAAAGVANALSDPMLEFHDANGALIKANDDYTNPPDYDAVVASGLAPQSIRESAMFATVAPGNYTAIVRGKDNAVGVALVEVYDVGF